MDITRRHFLSQSALLSLFSVVPLSKKAMAQFTTASSLNASQLDNISPISTLSAFKASTQITGDTHDEAHEIFWNKYGFIKKKGGLPRAEERYDVVVVGGGLSALCACYELAKTNKKVLLLEGHPRLGGNAKAEKYKNTYMSLGSAYITNPEPEGNIDLFLKDIGVSDKFRNVSHDDEYIALKGKIINGFWRGETDKHNREQFIQTKKLLDQIYNESFPDLPYLSDDHIDRKAVDRLDKIPFTKWLAKNIPDLHPHIEEYFHKYCWSSFALSPENISTAQALNFITSDLQGIQALPGGNGMIAAAIFDKVKHANLTVRTSSFAVDIREDGNKTYVCYHHQNKKLRAVETSKCIFTAPKMVAKDVIEGLPKDQHKAMDDINYHAYLVANVILKKNIPAPAYDIYNLQNSIPNHPYQDSKKQVFADITFANWANEHEAKNQALTLYIPIPYDMGQQYLFIDTLHDKYSKRVSTALKPFLSEVGINESDIDGIRLTRYGHALPAAEAGGISNRLFERAHRSVENRIFFANQDNWGNPCFETSFAVGMIAANRALGRDIL